MKPMQKEREDSVRPTGSMKKKKWIEAALVASAVALLAGFCIPTILTNVGKARVTASYLAAKAYYEEYLSFNNVDNLGEGEVIYYNDGHLFWVIDDHGNISEDTQKNEKTPLEK